MSKYVDFDEPQLCPHCKEPMQVLMPIWITPGDECIDTGDIDYESGNPQNSNNWWCNTCESHHFPIEQADEEFDASGIQKSTLNDLEIS